MYAVAIDRTRQIRLQEGQKLNLDYNQNWEAGSEVVLDQVCLLGTDEGTQIGAPYVDGAKVVLEPANQALRPIEVSAAEVQIRGVVCGLLRTY